MGLMGRRPSLLARLLRRSAPRRSSASGADPMPPVEPGPRREEWLVVGGGGAAARAPALARSLAASGLDTTYVARTPDDVAVAAGGGLHVRDWRLDALRRDLTTRVDRVRALLCVADAETIALARDLAAAGVRVAYDVPPREGPPPGPLSYAAQTERALVDAVEDLVAVDAKTARQASALAGGRRLVHVVPDGDGGDGSASASTLVASGGRPSVTALLATGTDAAETCEAVEAFLAARSDGAYRLAVVARADDPASETLDAMEEDGRIELFRSARPGRAAAWNLGLSATRSEIVALVHTSQRPDGVGWLAPALEALAAARDLGAVGLRARRPPGVVGREPDRMGSLRVPALDALGLVAPRGVLRRLRELDEDLVADDLFALDASFRVRDLGLALALCPPLGLRGGVGEGGDAAAAARDLRRRWRHRPTYLAGR